MFLQKNAVANFSQLDKFCAVIGALLLLLMPFRYYYESETNLLHVLLLALIYFG